MSREAGPNTLEVGVLQVYKLKHTSYFGNTIPLLFQVVVKKGTAPLFLRYEDFKRIYPQILISYLEKRFNIVTVGQKIEQNRNNLIKKEDYGAERQKILMQLRSRNSRSKDSKMINEDEPEEGQIRGINSMMSSYSYESSTEVNIDKLLQSQHSMRKIEGPPAARPATRLSPPKTRKRLILDPQIQRQQQNKKTALKKSVAQQPIKPRPKILNYQSIMRKKHGENFAIYISVACFSKGNTPTKKTARKKQKSPKQSSNKARQKIKKEQEQSSQQQEEQQPKTRSNRAKRPGRK